ncbi:hypothetical protein X943_001171 [Babesia divergens]|uniref:Uncharacterized protein n=1 Tax=Babesia divergens TaxID=32595 RepID=A0AAD9G6T2_BABDI|nr:hypothetical protein X943_001171 [Babesia divergens]
MVGQLSKGSVGICICSFILTCACWYIYRDLITTFYQKHVDEDFGKVKK